MTAKLPEGLREALGQVIANERREWRRERELIEAQARETIAELRSRIVEFERQVDLKVVARLADLKDGAPGADGAAGKDGSNGRDGVDGQAGKDGLAGRDGVDGKDGSQGERGLPGERGEPGPEVSEDQIEQAVGRYFVANPAPAGAQGEAGPVGEKGDRGDPGADGAEGAAGRDGLDGAVGPKGERGADGVLPVIKAWEDRVYYESEAVTLDGATYQALCDTGRAPPHDDWRCIAAAGRDGVDGRSFRIRGTYAEGEDYSALDTVVLNGASFAAKRDDPGACPGEGWQMIASQGKSGKPGERGIAGPKGDRGNAGPALVSVEADGDGVLSLINADGSTVTCDLYPLLSKLER